MALKEIDKLREKVEKDPNSKLFVPLAEEYKKEGMLDEAIQVLLTGIERQPGYMSARVSLGKIYLEKGMVNEARSEFENVIGSIPDNLYAHKKLAEIYRDSGEKELAVKSYRTILRLNSMDEDALSCLHELEEGRPSEEKGQPTAGAETASWGDIPVSDIQEGPSGEESSDDFHFGEVDAGLPEAPQEQNDDLNAFKTSLFGTGDEHDNIPEEIVAEDLPEADAAGDAPYMTGEKGVEDFSMDIQLEDDLSGAGEVLPVPEESPAGDDVSGISSGDVHAAENPAEGGKAARGVNRGSIEEADRKVSEGDYAEAIRIYREVLSDNPQDRKAMQRLDELRSLLKMLGRDKEELIARLNAFLEGLQRRQDEFLGRT